MSKPLTVLSLFCGAGGKTQGAIAAGYMPVGAIDYWQPAIDAYRQNVCDYAERGNLLDYSPKRIRQFHRSTLLMISPPCPNYSIAKIGAKETMIDLMLAGKAADFVRVLKPRAVIIENVPAYIKSNACKFLLSSLRSYGYEIKYEVVVAADLGAPQTRKRLIIRAVNPKKAVMIPIALTHNRTGKDGLLPWNGWFDAIADLIPALPESRLTSRQLEAVAAAKGDRQLIQRVGYYGKTPKAWDGSEPVGTIRASLGQDGKGNKRAHYMDCWLAGGNWKCSARQGQEPCHTVVASSKGRTRAVVDGEVRSLTPRALQRLQGLPDAWELPEDPRISVRLIGNSVVPVVAEAAARSIKYI